MTAYPFDFPTSQTMTSPPNSRGRIPSPQTSHLRTLWHEAHADKSKILAFPCGYDGLSSRLIEEAGFPMLFLSGFAVSSSHGIPDTGFIAMQEMCDKIQEVVRVTKLPVMVDGDTGYGSAMNVRRTVEAFAVAGAAGVMIEDQTWPKSISSYTVYGMELMCRMWSYKRKIGRFSRRSICSDSGSLRCARYRAGYTYPGTDRRADSWVG